MRFIRIIRGVNALQLLNSENYRKNGVTNFKDKENYLALKAFDKFILTLRL